eukprot:scaffold143_cov364-Pavlova_lutheri.AAC.14
MDVKGCGGVPIEDFENLSACFTGRSEEPFTDDPCKRKILLPQPREKCIAWVFKYLDNKEAPAKFPSCELVTAKRCLRRKRLNLAVLASNPNCEPPSFGNARDADATKEYTLGWPLNV